MIGSERKVVQLHQYFFSSGFLKAHLHTIDTALETVYKINAVD